ncbi:MAG: N-acetyl sugar amidotransferase [Nanoarchaeota archaeon]
MRKFQACIRCVMNYPSDPDIVFNEQGICNYCLRYLDDENKRRVDKLERPWLIDEIKKSGKNNEYDVVIGLSGGVDSSIALHYLKEQNLRPFAFSVDNGWNSKKSDENIMRLVETLKIPFYRYVLDKKEFVDLQSAFIKAGVKNIEIPTDHMLMAVSYEMAIKHNVCYIISGGNLATESIMPKAWGYEARDLKHIKAIFRMFNKREMKNLPTISLAQYLWYRFIKKIKVVSLLDYYEYNREEAKRTLTTEYGWKDYGEKHCESVFTWWFQTWYLPAKFGIDKRKAHYSSLINSEQMTRKEAMEKLLETLEYPEFGNEKRILEKHPKHEYTDYPNNEKLWNFLSKIYGFCKRT